MTQAVFAIPGDKDRRTGGFIYEATILRVLNEMGCKTDHLILPDSFPSPTSAHMATTLELLGSVAPEHPIILDGLVFGSIDPKGLARVRAPVIAMIHHPLGLETGLNPDRAAHLRANETAALTHAAHVIVPSPHTAEVLTKSFAAERDKITIALPGFDRPDPAPASLDPPLILSVGLLAKRKGHDVLIAALAEIRDLRWQARIVGKPHDPETANALRSQVRDLELSDRIHFEGEVSQPDLIDLYNAADIFALATRYEGYGMALNEAMQYGLPVVSCNTGAIPQTVGHAGILVPVDDASAFGEALKRLLTKPSVRKKFADLSQERAAILPTWQDTAKAFIKVIALLKTEPFPPRTGKKHY